jgi:ubiquinone/menaquinone biosynthesis C-methylase UbiE
MIFDEKTARSYDEWLKSPIGYYTDARYKKLICDLFALREGEKLLDVGCKTGNYLLLFRREGCDVTGVDSSPAMLESARRKLGHRADFHLAHPEDLPFSDNEFDVVSLITCLEFVHNPQKALEEAIRVARERIFIGFLNRYSLFSGQQTTKTIFHHASKIFSIWEMNNMIKRLLPGTSTAWGSVMFLPFRWYTFAAGLEELLPVMKNPFGSFAGMTVPIVYTQETIQDPLKNSLKVGVAKGHHMPGTAREMEK